MGKRAAEFELLVGNMGSIQREVTAFYAKRRTASHDNGTRTNSSQSWVRAKAPVYVFGSSHHQGTGLDESLSVGAFRRPQTGAAFITTRPRRSPPMASWYWSDAFSPLRPLIAAPGQRHPFSLPRVQRSTLPEALPVRTERHNPRSIAPLRRKIDPFRSISASLSLLSSRLLIRQ
jgi:hypothetical protein